MSTLPPDEFFDRFFGNDDDLDDWTIFYIELVPEDESMDPEGKAIQPTADDTNQLANEVFEECVLGEEVDDEPLTPDAVPIDAQQIETEVDQALPDVSERLVEANTRNRESRDNAVRKAHEAKESVEDALLAVQAAARASARYKLLSFHSWSMSQYRCAAHSYNTANAWCKAHPLGLAVVTVAVSVVIGMVS